MSGHKKRGSNQSSNSLGSMSSETVIIKEVPMDHLSSVLFRKQGRKQKELFKKSIAGLKSDSYTKTRVNQQIRKY